LNYIDEHNSLPPSWSSNYSHGNRTGLITVTSNTGQGAVWSVLVDGSVLINFSNSTFFSFGEVTPPTGIIGKYIQFTMNEAKKINHINIITLGNENSSGYWQIQASNDNSTWVTLLFSFEWKVNLPYVGHMQQFPNTNVINDEPTTLGVIDVPFTNNTKYVHYRLLGISGYGSYANWITEIFFKSD